MSEQKDHVILCEHCGKKFNPFDKVIVQSRPDGFEPMKGLPKISDELMIKESQYKIIETIVGLENECTLKPQIVTIYKDVITCAWVCKIGMEVRT
jgi:hypothetical protein